VVKEKNLMKISQHLLNALSGWVAGIVIAFGFSFLWQQIFPVVDRSGQGQGMMLILGIILAILSPFAIAGGVIGGRIPKEGGKLQQILYAAFFGAIFPLPFSCFLFWYTAW
jgi:hypothetical protein